MTQSNYEVAVDAGNTVISCFEPAPSNDFFQVKHTDLPPPQASSISRTLRKMGRGEQVRLDLVPGSFELVKYSMIDDGAQLNHAAGYLKRFISQAKAEYDLIVLDCNPSSSFVTKCALENSSHVLSPVKLDKFSILGVGLVSQLFDHLELELDHMIVINAVNRQDATSPVEVELRSHEKYGPLVLRNRLVQSKLLAADPSYTGFATDRKVAYSSTLRHEIQRISQEISDRIWGG